jgi:hypothetical protein
MTDGPEVTRKPATEVLRELGHRLVDPLLFWSIARRALLLALALALLGLCVTVATPTTNAPLFGLGVALTATGVVMSLYSFADVHSKVLRLRMDDCDPSLFDQIDKALPGTVYAGWRLIQNRNKSEAAIYSENLNSQLESLENIWVRTKDFEFSGDALRFYAPFIRERIGGQTNESKVRLCTDFNEAIFRDVENIGKPILLSKTDYFSSICTNEFSRRRLVEKGTQSNIVLDGRHLFVDSQDRLLQLPNSACSNHIGVSTLVITSDGKLPVGKQTRTSIGSPGRWAPTGSGSVDYADLSDVPAATRTASSRFTDLLKFSMQREVSEESNLPHQGLTTVIVGYARVLHRGGKPEFFGLSFSEASSGEVRVRGREPLYMEDYVHAELGYKTDDLAVHLRRVLNFYRDLQETSLILLLNLQFAVDYLTNQKGASGGLPH